MEKTEKFVDVRCVFSLQCRCLVVCSTLAEVEQVRPAEVSQNPPLLDVAVPLLQIATSCFFSFKLRLSLHYRRNSSTVSEKKILNCLCILFWIHFYVNLNRIELFSFDSNHLSEWFTWVDEGKQRVRYFVDFTTWKPRVLLEGGANSATVQVYHIINYLCCNVFFLYIYCFFVF